MSGEIKIIHPVQDMSITGLPKEVTERAYEVYSKLYGTNQSLARLNERAGFGAGEVIALLYARSFPEKEWSDRVNEAFNGMRSKRRGYL